MTSTSTNLTPKDRIPPPDPDFSSVVLLAPFSGHDGDTTSSDLSDSGHTLTFAGNAALDGDVRKFGFTSCQFDGDGDGVTAADSTDFDLGSGLFTVEAHVRFNGDPGLTAMAIAGHYTPTGDERAWSMNLSTSSGNQLRFSWSTNGTAGGYDEEVSSFNPVGEQWYHLAVSRDDTNLYMFVDGVLGTQVANSVTFHSATAPFSIGMWSDGNQPLDGWIENVRVTKGVCRYTSTFTPPDRAYPTSATPTQTGTSPRNTDIGDPDFDSVVLLAPFSGEDGDTASTDLSDSAHTLTFNGSIALDGDIRKFGFTSLAGDGTAGDFVSAADSDDWDFGSGDFTIEFNWRPLDITQVSAIVAQWSGAHSTRSWAIAQVNDDLRWVYSNGASSPISDALSAFTVNTWHHVAVVRDGTTFRSYVGGVQVDTSSASGVTINPSAELLQIGDDDSADAVNGNFENLRITKGVCRYPDGTTFTPPARAHPIKKFAGSDIDFSSVTLLLPLDGTDAATSTTDESNEAHTITFNANAQLDTAQSKFGSASCLFDGTGDYLSMADAASISPLTENFTVECHVRFNGDPTTGQHTFLGKWQGSDSNKEWWVGYRNNELNAFLSSNGSNGIFLVDVAWDPAGDTWYHIAFVFDRDLATNESRVYVDGIQVGASDTTLNTYATFFNSEAPLWIGGYDDDTNDWMDGWIDNVRITKGVARYKTNFRPPRGSYPNY